MVIEMAEEKKATEQSEETQLYEFKTRFFLKMDEEHYVVAMMVAVNQAEAEIYESQNLTEVSAEIYQQVGPDSRLIDGEVKQGEPRVPMLDNEAKQAIMTARLRDATIKIDTLQDAIDLEMATDEEKVQLTAWRKYRVLLSRLNTSTTLADWPAAPAGGGTE